MFDKFKKHVASIENPYITPKLYQLIDMESLRQYYERQGSPLLNSY